MFCLFHMCEYRISCNVSKIYHPLFCGYFVPEMFCWCDHHHFLRDLSRDAQKLTRRRNIMPAEWADEKWWWSHQQNIFVLNNNKKLHSFFLLSAVPVQEIFWISHMKKKALGYTDRRDVVVWEFVLNVWCLDFQSQSKIFGQVS